jgi:ubiquinone/menaquinone biosynthesis C-methylase UbiE
MVGIMNEEKFYQHKNYLKQDQYKSDNNLNARIHLHRNYSVNPANWFDWVFSHIDIKIDDEVLDVGCGPSGLWVNQIGKQSFPKNCLLTDLSFGMVKTSQNIIGNQALYANVDAMFLPFASNSADVIIANHMLYHVPDIEQTLVGFQRVLKPGGTLYAVTNGENHLVEMMDIAKKFTPSTIKFSRFSQSFSTENGADKLKKLFDRVDVIPFPDKLVVPIPTPIIDYIKSMITKEESIDLKYDEFRNYLEKEIEEKGPIQITKNSVLFIAKNN